MGVAIWSATIFNSLPSRLSIPGGFSLLIDNNSFFTSSIVTLQNSKEQFLRHTLFCLVYINTWLIVLCWHFLPEFTDFASKIIVKIISISTDNIYRFSYERPFHFNERWSWAALSAHDVIQGAPQLLSIMFYVVDLRFIIQFLLHSIKFSGIVPQFTIYLPIRCAA